MPFWLLVRLLGVPFGVGWLGGGAFALVLGLRTSEGLIAKRVRTEGLRVGWYILGRPFPVRKEFIESWKVPGSSVSVMHAEMYAILMMKETEASSGDEGVIGAAGGVDSRACALGELPVGASPTGCGVEAAGELWGLMSEGMAW